jgi:hypothetical protein
LPSQKPSVPQVEAPWSLQPPLGSVAPLTTLVHAPSVADSAHDWQVPAQAVLQQTPCAQKPETHSAPVAHARPLTLSPHDPFVQTAGEAQSASEVQVPLQTPVPHRNGKQDPVAGVTHAPAPSHVEVPVNWVLAAGQVDALHVVPLTYFWQFPAPSHLLLVPQLGAPWSTQVPAGSLAPTATLVQVPSVPASAHDRHAPVHALLQQMPWAQKVLMHSLPAVHEEPLAFFPHELLMQELGVRHWALVEHVVKQAVEPLQTYGLHACSACAMQAPVELQVEGGVNTLDTHFAFAHIVPTAYFSHPKLPSHLPSVPQVAAPMSVHTARGSAVPFRIGLHCPGVEDRLQLRQAPVQELSQQRPSTQKVDWHSPPAAHGWPLSLGPQAPATQAWPTSQSALVVQ